MKLNRTLEFGLFIALFAAATLMAQAPAANPGKMVFIDLDRAMISTKEGKSALDEFQKVYEAKAKEIQDMQAALEKGMSEFQAQQMTLSEEKRDERQVQLDEQSVALNRTKEDHQKSLERKRNSLIKKILNKMQPLIADYAKKNQVKAVFVIQQQMLAYVDESVNITNAIIKLYDEAYPIAGTP